MTPALRLAPPPQTGFVRAVLAMADDNGMIDDGCSADEYLAAVRECLIDRPDIEEREAHAINAWIDALSDDDLTTFVAGEEGEQRALIAGGGPAARLAWDLLVYVFEEVEF